jgi:hypothetical protein
MGFNKRYFDEKLIKENAQSNEYEIFKRYMLNPDSCVFMDKQSNQIWSDFFTGNEETRKTIYKKLRNEN